MRVRVVVLSMLALGACGASPMAEPAAPVAPAAPATTGFGTSPTMTVMHGDTAPPSAPSSIAPVAPTTPSRIDCLAYYRPLGWSSTEGAVEEPVTLDTDTDLTVLSADAQFETMGFRAEWLGEDRSLRLAVTAAGAELTSVLYQTFGTDLASIRFGGGHGFTGLHYVDHEGAQLQFRCSAA